MSPVELWKKISERFPTPADSFEFFKTFSSKKELKIVGVDLRNEKFNLRGEDTASVKAYGKLSFVDFGGDGQGTTFIMKFFKWQNRHNKFSYSHETVILYC